MPFSTKLDTRPKRFGWAPGSYYCKCQCGADFIGDKRAIMCADCAYALPDNPKAASPTKGVNAILADFAADKMETLKEIEALCDGDRKTISWDNLSQVQDSWQRLNKTIVEIRGLAKEALGRTLLKD